MYPLYAPCSSDLRLSSSASSKITASRFVSMSNRGLTIFLIVPYLNKSAILNASWLSFLDEHSQPNKIKIILFCRMKPSNTVSTSFLTSFSVFAISFKVLNQVFACTLQKCMCSRNCGCPRIICILDDQHSIWVRPIVLASTSRKPQTTSVLLMSMLQCPCFNETQQCGQK